MIYSIFLAPNWYLVTLSKLISNSGFVIIPVRNGGKNGSLVNSISARIFRCRDNLRTISRINNHFDCFACRYSRESPPGALRFETSYFPDRSCNFRARALQFSARNSMVIGSRRLGNDIRHDWRNIDTRKCLVAIFIFIDSVDKGEVVMCNKCLSFSYFEGSKMWKKRS